ncbi:tRNA wybutosine-synthesizing protein 3 homolog isoform X2 [Paramacrobiotus metropolitanus]|uniref:tRNA wybutosine-synthesizing protein 3 homolog isoform X2 n=1 Tax=Paramacrobiotus metropolitanus TaxID=2943436 RepID=UPI002446569C|nr:tRNA wybutosine-synthesizing protein 3 homolog isoform X2 [Paramacrobiotus metropolitanus]
MESIADHKFFEEKPAVVSDLCRTDDTKDNSRKGSFDREIEDLLLYLNDLRQFVSTSSCSGRVIVFSQGAIGKGACQWHFVAHSEYTPTLLTSSVESLTKNPAFFENDVFLKFEPFILHVRCETLADAQKLHAISVQSGFRNSGITIRKKGKEGFAMHVAVRCTHNFEMPLVLNGKLVTNSESLISIGELLARKMQKNNDLIDRALLRFQSQILIRLLYNSSKK